MKRDWDLIRKQLTDIENESDLFSELLPQPKWTDQTEAVFMEQQNKYLSEQKKIFGHLELLIDNGYIDGLQIIRSMDGGFHYGISNPRLTMSGFDLLDTMRSNAIWEKIKTTAKSKGIELTFDAIGAMSKLALDSVLK